MQIKITGCRNNGHWYQYCIGEIFHIKSTVNNNDNTIYIIEDTLARGVYSYDCEVLLDQEEYPTLSKGYTE